MSQPVCRIDNGETITLTTGVILDDHRTPPINHGLFDIDWAGRCRVNCALHGAEIISMTVPFGELQHTNKHNGHPLAMRHFVLIDQRQGLRRIKLLHDDGGSP